MSSQMRIRIPTITAVRHPRVKNTFQRFPAEGPEAAPDCSLAFCQLRCGAVLRSVGLGPGLHPRPGWRDGSLDIGGPRGAGRELAQMGTTIAYTTRWTTTQLAARGAAL